MVWGTLWLLFKHDDTTATRSGCKSTVSHTLNGYTRWEVTQVYAKCTLTPKNVSKVTTGHEEVEFGATQVSVAEDGTPSAVSQRTLIAQIFIGHYTEQTINKKMNRFPRNFLLLCIVRRRACKCT
jgi:hypothetical protein